MNILAPRPWDSIAYASVCIIAIAMAVFTFFFLSAHCEWVYVMTGIAGACGLGYGWLVFTLAFLAIAVYSGRELYLLLVERQGK